MSKVLIVEDEEAIADIEKDYLELSGFEVTICKDGTSGLAEALDGEYDICILDVMLPGIDGFEICKKVRETKNIPIIMVSAKKEDIDKIRGLGVGADDYMTKPFSPSELVARVKAHLSRYERLINSSQPENDIIEIGLKSKIRYNPLHKPNLNPIVLANRLKTILLLFSENNSESFWLDKAEQILAECIKLCRLYNNGYVTFIELHKLITEPDYYKSKIEILKNLFYESKFSHKQIYELNTALEFLEKEFNSLDNRTMSILKSEISRITNIFVSDYNISNIFCPPKKELNFKGFSSMLQNGKIVVLNMNIAEYKNLSQIIAAYLKLDFQSEVMSNLSHSKTRPSAFICDEYAEYVTKTDADFFSLSREAKCINIISTQSYSSLKNSLKDETAVKVITQNLINKIWFRTDDIFTIEEAQKQLGKEEKVQTSTSISENAKETKFSYITNSLNSQNSSITESINTYKQKDFMYDTNFFTQNLETFSSLVFLSNGYNILKPSKLKMFPYFKK